MSPSDKPPVILWFRNDLRLADNPALHAAAADGGPVVPLYVLDDAAAGDWKRGAASRWWLHHSLESLAAGLAGLRAPLVLRRGDATAIVPEIVRATGARRLLWNRRYEPFGIAQDKRVEGRLRREGVAVESFNASLVAEPWEISQKSGGHFRMFTPYSRVWFDRLGHGAPLPAPVALRGLAGPEGERLEGWNLLPLAPDWAGGMRAAWVAGEGAAHERARAFLDGPIERYGTDRNLPAKPGTSRISPHLHFGEVSPRQLIALAAGRAGAGKDGLGAARPWVRELCWRDFAHHSLYYAPGLPDAPLRRQFEHFRWEKPGTALRAWQRGRTGYPIVDAAMRQLWTTGWMHNRLRMLAGSFLVKDLLIPWQEGERWFWDCLVDADLADNSINWQWVAGSGVDSSPYFRVFNPLTQGEKFDPEGEFVRAWVPELARLPGKTIHRPFDLPRDTLQAAGVRLGETYPEPIVDHGQARDRALGAYYAMRRAGGGRSG